MRLAVVGASGRMGRAVVRLAHAAGVEIVCAVGATDIGRDAGELAGVGAFGTCVVDGLAAIEHAKADVVIDFSAPAATLALAPIAAAAGSALVSGTTGLGDDAREAFDRAAARVPVLWEPNMSLGIHVLSELVRRASSALADWDAEIIETHHRAKVDAPSGTALRLAESTGRARVGMHSLRGGDVIGDHEVHFLGGGERIELAHRATNRDVFAYGALRAARFVAGRAPGRYGLRDVLRT
ncbi:MAG: 4-hydroxy-tetrahydrodipicolinate reductase [Polyangiaceae bacterium]|jgi:4-hydroxy-tetrahydrodipicolinate reductase